MSFFKQLDISKPTLLLDRKKVEKNIEKMSRKATSTGVELRPHFKTHQSQDIGRLFKAWSIEKITVSSLSMAEKFAADGWKDITVAFPVNVLELDTINRLAGKIQLNLLVDCRETVEFLQGRLNQSVNIFIKIDVGNRRAGISWEDESQIVSLAKLIESTKKMNFSGLLTHAGQTYASSSIEDITEIHQSTISRLLSIKDKLLAGGISNCLISVGDTPTCSLMKDFTGVDEIRPGNFVFYDVMQAELGACGYDEISVAIACPVVSKYPERGEILLYGGVIHFSKEYILNDQNQKVFGYLAESSLRGWEGVNKACYLSGLSQEHGLLKVPAEVLDEVNIGDVLLIYPVHSCLSANLLRSYITPDGEVLSFD